MRSRRPTLAVALLAAVWLLPGTADAASKLAVLTVEGMVCQA